MPTEREIENMMEYAENNTEEVFKSVYAELAGIAKQNVWRAATTGNLKCAASGKHAPQHPPHAPWHYQPRHMPGQPAIASCGG